MADPNRIENATVFNGKVTFAGEVQHKAASVENEAIGADAANPIDAEKVEREFCIYHASDVDSAIAAFDLVKHLARAAGEVLDCYVSCVTPPTGDYTLTVDVQKWNGSAWSSILDAAEVVDSDYVANTPVLVTLTTTTTYASGDMLRIIGTLAGTSGTHAQGVLIQCRLREKP